MPFNGISLIKLNAGAKVMTRQFRALAALTEGLSSILSLMLVFHQWEGDSKEIVQSIMAQVCLLPELGLGVESQMFGYFYMSWCKLSVADLISSISNVS